MTTRPTSASAPSRRAMLARTSAVQAMIGASRLTAASTVSMPTFSAPKRPHSAKNFSLTSALIGAVYQLRVPAASAAYCAPVATSDLPDPVGVASTTFAPLTSSISASSCAGYSVVPPASAQAANRLNSSSASSPSARSGARSAGSSSSGGAVVEEVIVGTACRTPVPFRRPASRRNREGRRGTTRGGGQREYLRPCAARAEERPTAVAHRRRGGGRAAAVGD